MSKPFDLIVIGAGSGGVRAARLAAARGWRVAITEQRFAGGTCVNVGCVPKKLMGYAAAFPHAFSLAADFGWQLPAPARLDWATLKANRDREISRLRDLYARLLRDSGVTLVEGHARLQDAHTVRVGEQLLRSERILVATGSRPQVPDIPGAQHLLVSDALFDLGQLPARVVVWGGGYIATEFASILNGLGSAVTLVHRGPHILDRFDSEAARFLQAALGQQGVRFMTGCRVTAVQASAQGYELALSDGSTVAADAVFAATGRVANTVGLGLEAVGIATDARGNILVDGGFRSSAPGVFALGDVIGGVQLTPVALRQAMNLIGQWFEPGRHRPLPLDLIPNAVFSNPGYASVGLTEEQARQAHARLRVYRSAFRPLDHSLGEHPGKVFLKLLVDAESDALLGAHMVGEGAAEVIQGVAMAMACGASKAQLDNTLGIHPTVAEEWVTLRSFED